MDDLLPPRDEFSSFKIDKRKVRSNVKEDHQSTEVFRTPFYVYDGLIDMFPEYFSGSILDPSAGDGRMVDSIIKRGNTNQHCIIDIRNEEKQTWHDNGLLAKLGEDNCVIGDFLNFPVSRQFDCLLTNPPFSLAQSFVEKGLLQCKRVVVIQKSSWIGTQKRSKWFTDLHCLKHVIVIPVRPKWELDDRINGNFDSHEYFWYIFEQNYVGPVMLDWQMPKG